MLGVGRGRKCAIVLAYQNLGQVYAHYGVEGGDAVLGSINTMVFLPGLDQRTTEFAAKRTGKTTVLQHTTVDAVGTKYDAERLAETKRDLMDPTELRQLVSHKQAVAIIGAAPPIKFSYPPFVQASPDELAHATNKGSPIVASFRNAEIRNFGLEDASALEHMGASPTISPRANPTTEVQKALPNEAASNAAPDDICESSFEQDSMKE